MGGSGDMKLFVATPMYAGQCYGAYTDSLVKLAVAADQRKIPFRFFPIFNESHIDRARNVCADQFLQSGFSHLLFIDSDLSGYKPEDVFNLMAMDKEIICGFYPKKRINWRTVAAAVRAGLADKDPEVLQRFVGDMVFTPALDDDSNRFRTIYDLTKLHEGGTGFMLIRREALLKIAEIIPERQYHRHYKKPEMMTAFFDAQCEPEWQVYYRRFITEDFEFCRLAREANIGIWLAPWIKLIHHGYYQFIGDIEAIAMTQQQQVGEAA
jgi:hypothetical protein